MSELQYAVENIIPRIESGEVVSGEIVFDALELWTDVKPIRAMSMLIEVFKPLATGRRHVHIREESNTPSVVLAPHLDDFKRIEHRVVDRYVVSWFEVPEGHNVPSRSQQDAGEASG